MIALIWTEIAVGALVLLFGAFAFVSGVLAIISAITGYKDHRYWWVVLLEGLIGVALGIVTIVWPQITTVVLLLLIAGWAIATGILQIIAAIILRQEMTGEWLLIGSGVFALVLGILLAIQPRAGAIALVWLLGAYAILVGIVLLLLALRLRGWYQEIKKALGQV